MCRIYAKFETCDAHPCPSGVDITQTYFKFHRGDGITVVPLYMQMTVRGFPVFQARVLPIKHYVG